MSPYFHLIGEEPPSTTSVVSGRLTPPSHHVDAFANAPFGGNGCAVVHDGAELSDAVCMAYVKETSLVECTFTGPSDVADIRVKYYLASREIPFASHLTIATAAALRYRGLIGEGKTTLETGAGIVAIDVLGEIITMTQIAPNFGVEVPPEIVAATGGITAGYIISPPQIVSTGLPFHITMLLTNSPYSWGIALAD